MAGLPGAYDRYDIPGLRRMLERYHGMTRETLRDNLARFLREVIPTAEEVGIRMCIHPDDPPRPLLGCRASSATGDFAFILGACESDANGITFCTGSLGAGREQTTSRRWPSASRDRIQFAHLRNVAKEPDGSFMEADHLGGDTDMVAVVTTLLEEQSSAAMPATGAGASRSGRITAMSCSTISARRPSRATRPSAA